MLSEGTLTICMLLNTIGPYRCTEYICLYVCCAAGFDDLGSQLFLLTCLFFLEK